MIKIFLFFFCFITSTNIPSFIDEKMSKDEIQFSYLNAGYTPIPNLFEEKKVGIYGKSAKLFTILVFALLLIALLNLVVSFFFFLIFI